MNLPLRHPAVAGRFYPRDRDTLLDDVEAFLDINGVSKAALGCVAPHAGYIYSGGVAGAVYAAIDVPRRCLVLCPNHTGKGKPLAIMSEGAWETPLGTVPIDTPLADALREQFPALIEDAEAHRSEHAIEVQLPFLQLRNPQLIFVPIALGTGQFDILEQLGNAVADVLPRQPEPVLIVASSDMNHYENDRITREKDHKAIEQILAMDAPGLFDIVMKEDISMCGYGPTVVMLTAAKRLGAKAAELVKYATSGDVSGDRETVVGYAGIVVG
ncbi:MAG: AmmeMemoRadiSam system protein B [Terriglobales bacterium]